MVSVVRALARPPWRIAVPAVALVLVGILGYALWSPGLDVADGRHDRGRNGIWLQHGWLADDAWLARNGYARAAAFRSAEQIRALAELLRRHGIADVFPHLCPASSEGALPAVGPAQAEQLLDELTALRGFRVMPWIGGVRGESARVEAPEWRRRFCQSALDLLSAHPRFAGVHVNIEPCPSGSRDFLDLLDELRRELPAGKLVSVAAYPPPTRWQPAPDVHWDEVYFREVARRCDQMAVMMYDTSIRRPKLYRSVMKSWTREVLDWSGPTPVLLGLPAYDDAGSGYHFPEAENLPNALLGVHAGLAGFEALPASYQGTAIYCEWEMDAGEWAQYGGHFVRDRSRP